MHRSGSADSTDDTSAETALSTGEFDEPTVRAVGAVSEALETVERARGHLYAFHQLTGRADAQLDSAVSQLRDAGHSEIAADIADQLIGRNVLPGRWTFQIVEEYDDGYHRCFQETERVVRERLTAGRRHVYEARMKDRRRTDGHPAHEATPTSAGEESAAEKSDA